MKTLSEITTILARHLPTLTSQYHVKEMGLFGSYAKHAQTEASDLDVLVDFEKTPSLFELVELKLTLSGLLNMEVDVVMKNSLKPHIGKRILQEVIIL